MQAIIGCFFLMQAKAGLNAGITVRIHLSKCSPMTSLAQGGQSVFPNLNSSQGRIKQLCYNILGYRAMKKELMDILVCPVCKGELELKVNEEKEAEIVSGSLYCRQCDVHYSIIDTIPNLLPPEKGS